VLLDGEHFERRVSGRYGPDLVVAGVWPCALEEDPDFCLPPSQVGAQHRYLLLVGEFAAAEALGAPAHPQLVTARGAQVAHPLGFAAGRDQEAVLDGDAYADAVRADEEQAARYGITGVPFFVADGKSAVSGAQPPEVLLQLLQRAHDEASQLTPVAVTTGSDSGASCDGDSCAVG
jgi:DSBA-like thioredoxin domain